MTIDLNALSTRDLDALINQAKRRKTVLKKRKTPAQVRSKIQALVAAEGYTLPELYQVPGTRSASKPASAATSATQPAARKGRKLGKVAPKYRNPADPKQAWSGRGLKPKWMAELIKKGKKVEDFLIKK